MDIELRQELAEIKELIAKYVENDMSKNAEMISEKIKNAIMEPEYNIDAGLANQIKITIYNSFGILFSRSLSEILNKVNAKYSDTLKKKQEINIKQKKVIELFKDKIHRLNIINDELIYKNREYSNEISILKEKELHKNKNKDIAIQTDTSLNPKDDLNIDKNMQQLTSFKKSIYRLWDGVPRVYFKLCYKCRKYNLDTTKLI